MSQESATSTVEPHRHACRPPAPPAEWEALPAAGILLRFGYFYSVRVSSTRSEGLVITPTSWFVGCNKAALENLLDRARLDPLVAPRIPPTAPAPGVFTSKDGLVQLLYGLRLLQADLDRLRAPAPG